MTSPITLLTALGAAEPAAPTPAPEDHGLFNAVLTAAHCLPIDGPLPGFTLELRTIFRD